jgi:hypothetical protein
MLVEPLTSSQIDAACEFWNDNHLEVKEFAQLRRCFPEPHEAVTLKAVAVNALYQGGIIAIGPIAEYLESKLPPLHDFTVGLIEEMATEISTITKDRHHVFLSKFAHFFLNSDLPILDRFAEWMVERHLGLKHSCDPKRYFIFAANIQKLKKEAGLTCSWEELDHYLWIAGEYWCWKRNPKTRIYRELRDHFERLKTNPDTESTLSELLGIAEKTATP